nr:hypothetical protein Iba_chr12cCG21890 [Ipomoea batatas]
MRASAQPRRLDFAVLSGSFSCQWSLESEAVACKMLNRTNQNLSRLCVHYSEAEHFQASSPYKLFLTASSFNTFVGCLSKRRKSSPPGQ